MLKKVQLSQECAEYMITSYQFMQAIVRGDEPNTSILQSKLARYDSNQVDGYWSELWDQYHAVKGKETGSKIQRSEAANVKGNKL